MQDFDLSEFEIEEKARKLRICRFPNHVPADREDSRGIAVTGTGGAPPVPVESHVAEEKGVYYIKSPLVGTFYRAPSPEVPPFVEIGTVVKPDAVVCIIEAMKVMNEIQSEVAGEVFEFLVENGQTVEYGQSLVKIKSV